MSIGTRTNLYVVFDKVAMEIFGSIIRAANHEVARRSFHDLLTHQESPIATHKGDYDMIWLGQIDNFGNIHSKNGDSLDHLPELVASGQDWLDANKETTK